MYPDNILAHIIANTSVDEEFLVTISQVLYIASYLKNWSFRKVLRATPYDIILIFKRGPLELILAIDDFNYSIKITDGDFTIMDIKTDI